MTLSMLRSNKFLLECSCSTPRALIWIASVACCFIITCRKLERVLRRLLLFQGKMLIQLEQGCMVKVAKLPTSTNHPAWERAWLRLWNAAPSLWWGASPHSQPLSVPFLFETVIYYISLHLPIINNFSLNTQWDCCRGLCILSGCLKHLTPVYQKQTWRSLTFRNYNVPIRQHQHQLIRRHFTME